MADNSVFITGAAKGSLAEALNGLPPWATESTAVKIQGILQKSLGQQSKILAQLVKSAGGVSGNDLGKVNDELDKLVKGFAAQNVQQGKQKKRAKEEDDESKKSLIAGRKFTSFTDRANFALSAFGKAGSAVTNIYDRYITVSDSLSKSGINLLAGQDKTVEGMSALNNVVKLTRLRLEVLQEVALKYSNTINAVGFTKFAKASANASIALSNFGYTSKETAELVATYAESERAFTDVRNKSEKELADGATILGSQMARLTLITGQSREQMQENMKSVTASTNAMFISARYGPEAAKNMLLATASLKPELKNMLEDMAGAAAPELSESFKQLQASGQGQLANQLFNISKQMMSAPEAGIRSLEEVGKGIIDNQRSVLYLNEQKAGPNAAAAQATAQAMLALQNMSTGTSRATEKQIKDSIAGTAVNAKFRTEQEALRASMEAAFHPMQAQVESLTTALKSLNSAIYGSIDAIGGETLSWIGAGLIIAGFAGTVLLATRVASTVINFFSGFLTPLSIIGSTLSVLAAGAAGFGIGTIFYKIFSNFDWFNSMLDTAFKGLDKVLSFIPGSTGRDADARSALRAKAEAAAAGTVTPSTISVPKAPAPSTIQSPSAVPANPQSTRNSQAGAAAPDPTAPIGPGIEKPAKTSDINSLITFQNSLMQQLIEGTRTLISINRDILKYTRNQT